MEPSLDIDLLKTFISIAEAGSFAGAAEEVGRTQSAVSMQMKRLEELVGRPLFARAGRKSRLTADGEQLLDYARRIVRLSNEALTSISQPELSGVVRLGTPDDYADRLLPEILARFSRTHPLVQVEVECRSSRFLVNEALGGKLDLAIVTCGENTLHGEIIRMEPLVWVTSSRHHVHEQEVLPLAASTPTCEWRDMVLGVLESTGRPYRIAYSSANSLAVSAAVLSGLAVAGIPEIVLRPGMRVLTEADGFPDLGDFGIGLVRSPQRTNSAIEALADHITDSLARINRPMMAAE